MLLLWCCMLPLPTLTHSLTRSSTTHTDRTGQGCIIFNLSMKNKHSISNHQPNNNIKTAASNSEQEQQELTINCSSVCVCVVRAWKSSDYAVCSPPQSRRGRIECNFSSLWSCTSHSYLLWTRSAKSSDVRADTNIFVISICQAGNPHAYTFICHKTWSGWWPIRPCQMSLHTAHTQPRTDLKIYSNRKFVLR